MRDPQPNADPTGRAPRDARVRTLPFAFDRPAVNLARDAALLATPGPATLRLYGWRPAGLSLGRFQDPRRFATLAGAHDLVRRQTGGGAIFHGDELTFALVVDATEEWTIDVAYEQVHDAVLRALASVGVAARRIGREAAAGPGPRAARDAWCFEHPARHDLVAPCGRKLCGSAQRRTRRPVARVLHHGSIPLRRPSATPFCAAVEDQVDVDRVREPLADALVAELAAALGGRAVAGEWTATERALAARLEPDFAVSGAPATR